MRESRREFIKRLSAFAAIGAVGGCATTGVAKAGRVVVIGGGYGGATAAKYIRMWGPDIDVTLVERNEYFVSCPISNLVIGGSKTIADVTVSYGGLAKYGVKVMRDEAVQIDSEKRVVQLASGATLSYDRLVVAPGVDFVSDQIPALSTAAAFEQIPHSWKAGPQTVLLRRQLEAMRDGGVYAICVPKSPYRCPPGPYERACQVANYFKKAKPKSKVLILDANEDVQSKKGLFMTAWNGPYKGMVEYRPNSELVDVDVKTRTAKLQFDEVRADVLNVVPPQRAGDIAQRAGLITANDRWCGVDWLSMESVARRNIHVLGDATLSAPAMPKSGHMANQHAKIAAAAIVELMHGRPPFQAPVIANTCYSFIDDRNVVHVASVHAYDAGQKTLVVVKGSGGLSSSATEIEGQFAMAWAQNIWSDMLS
jgi:sulfide dehydrogenase [flavocytochrome c] flavoprotein subunit